MHLPNRSTRLAAVLGSVAGLLLILGTTIAGAEDSPYPLTMTGDGMTLVVNSDAGENPIVIKGTMQVTTSQAWPMEARLTRNAAGDLHGSGEVRAGQRRVPFTISVDSQQVTRVTLAGKVYTLAHAPRGTTPSVTPGVTPGTPGVTPAQPTPRAPAAEKTLRVAPHKITNATRNGQNFHSHTLLVPKGWQVQGGTFSMHPSFLYNFPSLNMKVSAPDGREVFVAPLVTCTDTLVNGQRPPANQAYRGFISAPLPRGPQELAQDMAEKLVPMIWQGASQVRITNSAALPEYRQLLMPMLKRFQASVDQQRAMARQNGIPMQFFLDGNVYGLEGEFSLGGRRYEFLRIVTIWWRGHSSPQGHEISWQTLYDVTFKAPAGELGKNLMTLRMISNSVQATPAWHQVLQERAQILARMRSNMARDNQRTFERINKINTSTSAEIQDIINKGYSNRTRIENRTHAKIIRAVQETSLITPPGSNAPLEVSMHWQNIYSNGSELIFTMDPKFEPGPGWSPVQRKN